MDPEHIFKTETKFVETAYIKNILNRIILYLQAGFPVHLSGPAGTGKTTLALHVADFLNQPAVLIFGSDKLEIPDLIGGEIGYKRKLIVDKYNRRVEKREEHVQQQWSDGRVVTACKNGYTLIYDEYTRSRPEVNNILLPVLEEKIIEIPEQSETFLKVHPDFKAIFTSNPVEYAGVYKSQDALLDRMITINLENFDRETEVSITVAKTGLSWEEAEKIVDLIAAVRNLAQGKMRPTIRGSIMIGRVVKQNTIPIDPADQTFREICYDIIGMEFSEWGANMQTRIIVNEALSTKDSKEQKNNEDSLKSEDFTKFGYGLEQKSKIRKE
ncbi:MAG: gas vesicle protein GvpN [Dethiobacter sp.]|jgi:gas vesicle protein GvpN|nr:MAG: gas vesicle protein GvpN [Dethiobacter sp.]